MKISIITVSYNSERTIERTIQSVLSQTYSNYEYIIIDGNSKDKTIDIIRKYEPQFDGRMFWISEVDTGIYNAMNKGILKATGDIIGLVNSDDWLAPQALEIVSSAVGKYQISRQTLICGSMLFHYKTGKFQLFHANEQKFYEGIPHFSYNRGLYHPAVYVPRDVYQGVGLFDEKFSYLGDVDFIYRCYKEEMSFFFLEEVLTNMSDGGISNSRNLGVVIKENSYMLNKHGVPKWKILYLMTIKSINVIIKKIIPVSVLKKYRELKSV